MGISPRLKKSGDPAHDLDERKFAEEDKKRREEFADYSKKSISELEKSIAFQKELLNHTSRKDAVYERIRELTTLLAQKRQQLHE